MMKSVPQRVYFQLHLDSQFSFSATQSHKLIFVYRQRKKSVKENKQSAVNFLLHQPIKQRHTTADRHHHKHINVYSANVR